MSMVIVGSQEQLTFTEHVLYTRHSEKPIASIVLFRPHTDLCSTYYYSAYSAEGERWILEGNIQSRMAAAW